MKKLLLLLSILLLTPFVQADGFMYQDVNENVDLYTGDYHMSIPLTTVNGRGGYDYLIDAKYNSNVKLNSKPSEIGLGWDLGIPKIYRNRINIPDDYLGGGVNQDPNIEMRYEDVLINGNTNSGSFVSKLFDAMSVTMGSMMSPQQLPLGVFNAVGRALGSSEINEVLRDCSGYCSLYTNGFRFTGVDSNHGVEVYNTYDSITPDLYTLSGNYLSGQLILSSLPGQEHQPKFHFKRVQGHANDDVDMDQCTPTNTDKCNDAVNIEFTNLEDNTYGKFFIQDKSGASFVFEPTKSYVSNGNFALRLLTTVEPMTTCAFYGENYIETQYLEPFAYEFGMTAMLDTNYVDVNGNGYPDEADYGNWVRIQYDETVNSFRNMYPFDGTCIEGPDGKMIREESYHNLKFPSRIETPTHFATFTYGYSSLNAVEYGGSKRMPRLDSIKVYAKRYPDTVLEEISISYHYSVARETPEASAGRLTLHSITREGMNNAGSNPAITFDYAEEDVDWEKRSFDKWGDFYDFGTMNDHNQAAKDVGLIPGVWALSSIAWPSGATSYITYEKDRYTRVNAWYGTKVSGEEREDTHFGGGSRVRRTNICKEYGICYDTFYGYTLGAFDGTPYTEETGYGDDSIGGESSGVASLEPGSYTARNNVLSEGSSSVQPYVGYSRVIVAPGFSGSAGSARNGWKIYEFTTAADFPNTGKYIPPTRWTIGSGEDYGLSVENGEIPESLNPSPASARCPFLFIAPKGHLFYVYIDGSRVYPEFTMSNTDDCNLYDTTPSLSCELTWFSWNKAANTIDIGGEVVDLEATGIDLTAKAGYTVSFRDMSAAGDPYVFTNVIVNDETHHCCVDEDVNGVCDLMEVPLAGKTSATDDNDHSRGLLKKVTWYEYDGTPVKTSENDYSHVTQTNFGNGLVKSVWNKLDSVTNIVDGVTTIEDYDYNLLNGLPSKITTRGTSGKSSISTKNYAYINNPSMMTDKHMWAQLAQERVYDSLETGSNLEFQKSYTYSNTLTPNSEWQWNMHEEKIGSGTEEVTVMTYEEYDDFGNVLKVVDGENNPSWFYYGDNEECGETTTPDATGGSLSHAYITCEENALNQQTMYSYDLRGNLEDTTTPDGVIYTQEYDADNRISKKYRNNVLLEEYDYETVDLGIWDSATTTIESAKHLSNSENVTTALIYDPFLDLEKKSATYEDGEILENYYYEPLSGNLLAISEPYYSNIAAPANFERFTFERTPEGRLAYHERMGSTYSIDFWYTNIDSTKSRVTTFNEEDIFTSKEYDYFGNLVSSTDWSDTTTFVYDMLGNVVSSVNPLDETSSFDYDTRNLLKSRQTPETGSWTFLYDDNNNVEYKTDARDITIRYWYDELNRLEKIDFPNDDDVVFDFDAVSRNGEGKITSMNDGSGSSEYYYDSDGRLFREEIRIGSERYIIDYQHNRQDLITSIIAPDIEVVYTYDLRGLIDTVTVNGELIDVEHNKYGTEKSLAFSNGVSSDFYYNGRNWPSAIDINKDGEAIVQETYRYDSESPSLPSTVGNLEHIYSGVDEFNPGDFDSLSVFAEFDYDENNRIRHADFRPLFNVNCEVGPDCADLSFTYDDFGNRESKNGVSYSYDHADSDSLLTDDGTFTYTYDENGNLETKTHKVLDSVTEFVWNDNNMLAKVIFPDAYEEEYVYDGKDRRVMKKNFAGTTYYLYDQFNNLLFEEFISS